MRDWITGTGSAEAALSRSALRAKADFRGLPAGDLEALVAYLTDAR